MKIATIWGHDRLYKDFVTHHSFWEATLRDMGVDHAHYLWSEFMDMPRTFDAYLFIDFHPRLYRLEKNRFKNTVFYWNDSFHFSLSYAAQVCDRFDMAYMAERGSAEPLAQRGYPVSWLPAAFYPGLYRPMPESRKVHHYGFVGQQDDVVVRKGLTRRSFLVELGQSPEFHGYLGQGVYGETVNQVYNESQVLFDRTIFYNVGTRIFEGVGSGGFFLMNRLPRWSGLDQLAEDGQHYVSYDDSYEDFAAKMRYYLLHPEEAAMIATRGHAHFRQHHTYEIRIRKIIEDLER